MHLADLLTQYALERDLSDGYILQLEITVRQFEKWLAHRATLSDLTDDTVNRWLQFLNGTPVTKRRIKGHRGNLLTIWYAAADDGLIAKPERVRKINVPETVPYGFTHEQLNALLAECDRLTGTFRKSPLRRRIWARSLIDAKYDTALRLGDMLAIERDWIWRGGFLSIVQKKTGHSHRVQLRPETMAEIDECMADMPDRRNIWALPFCRRRFFEFFHQLVVRAGLRGSSKWIRRSSASYMEREHPGMAWRHLGHKAPGLDRKHYLDPSIAYPPPPLPPKIE